MSSCTITFKWQIIKFLKDEYLFYVISWKYLFATSVVILTVRSMISTQGFFAVIFQHRRNNLGFRKIIAKKGVKASIGKDRPMFTVNEKTLYICKLT